VRLERTLAAITALGDVFERGAVMNRAGRFRLFIHVIARGCVTTAAILLELAGAAVVGHAKTDNGIPRTLIK
jgi:hypothetical protein